LGLQIYTLGASYKIDNLNEFILKYDLQPTEILYMGDDLPDYEVLKIVGVPCCPADAVEEIKSVSHYISPFEGGKGCVRDVIEQVLRLHGRWMDGESFSW